MQPNAEENTFFRFLGYKISSYSFEVKDDFSPHKVELIQKISFAKQISEKNPRAINIKLVVELSSKESNFELKLSLIGRFEADKEMDDRLFEKLSNQNAPAILYPFARAFIASMTSQANMPPIILPVVNLSHPTNEK